jgi:NADPH:quinone reductase-like Zn-dependent oxidoreductase
MKMLPNLMLRNLVLIKCLSKCIIAQLISLTHITEQAFTRYVDNKTKVNFKKINQFPYTLGSDGAGEVEAVGSNVKDLSPGDRVAFFTGGTYAEYVVGDISKITKIPDGISLEAAAACMVNGLT